MICLCEWATEYEFLILWRIRKTAAMFVIDVLLEIYWIVSH